MASYEDRLIVPALMGVWPGFDLARAEIPGACLDETERDANGRHMIRVTCGKNQYQCRLFFLCWLR